MSPGRALAFEILRLVEGGGHASDLLHARSKRLDARDAALASELVLGALRRQAQLDFLIQYWSGKPAVRLDAEVRIALRLGIYQLRHLDRIPGHAAVSESVELTKRAHKRSAAGFVNAVLRKVNRSRVPWPDRATQLSQPAWLLDSWERQFGREMAERIARRFLEPAETYLRVPAGREGELEGLEAEPTDVPGCYRLTVGRTDRFRHQDIGSQSVVPLLRLEVGQRLLDVCAAPGNKTAQALEYGARVVACDHSPGRLRALAGLDCERVVLDGSFPLPFACRFERILLDAPCSGTGTLSRNPEIRWRVQPSDLGRHRTRQVAMLRCALERLAAGGRLVYSTCSLEREEDEEVVDAALDGAGDRYRLLETMRRLPGVQPGDGFFAAVITSK